MLWKGTDDHMTRKQTPRFIHIVFFLNSALAVFPLLLIVMVSLTDEKTVQVNGYSMFPAKFSLYAYQYLSNDLDQILRSYGVTAFVTLLGTVVSVIVTAALAYPLSRPTLPFRRAFTFLFSSHCCSTAASCHGISSTPVCSTFEIPLLPLLCRTFC